jgi:hypothetical protein
LTVANSLLIILASDASVAIETNLQSDLDDVGKELDLRQEKKLK